MKTGLIVITVENKWDENITPIVIFAWVSRFMPAGKMKYEFFENPSSTLLGYSRISNLIQAHFWDFLEIVC